MKLLLPIVGAVVLCAAVTPAASADPGFDRGMAVTVASFEAPDAATKAFTYDPALVPVGAKAMVMAVPARESTKVLLSVHGLVPNRTYGAHAHQRPCGTAAADSGAHHQHVVDPNQPSVDPAYANPNNEIWLDFTTDHRGWAVVKTAVPWRFADRRAGSVVVHAQKTSTEAGKAGTAGPRVACATVKF
ncbi:superoxide dismutase [Saccharothrix deserti]|uniref:superoxide dismutase n=1 Tax=Saccharothrix deserti TaxID=2593674 RepID=UPI00131E07E9|nr:superoxide dismutase [Saccharothrix deserti]